MSSFEPPITPDPMTPGLGTDVGATGTTGTTGPTGTGSGGGSGGGSAPKEMAGAAAEQGKQVAGTAVEQGREVAHTAKEGAKDVAAQATQQATDVVRTATEEARRMFGQVGGEARTQADTQAERVAESLRGIAGQLQAAASGQPLEAGPVRDLADQAGAKVDMIATRLADGGLDGLVQDVGTFARRRPGMFLAGALAGGFVAGRLLRSARDASTGSDGTSGDISPYRTYEPSIDLTTPAPVAPVPAADVATTGATSVDPTLVGGVGPMDAPTAGIS